MLASVPHSLAMAVRLLRWDGPVVGPVDFGGALFWAVVSADPALSGGRLLGTLFQGRPSRELMREASLVAAYAPRALVVDESEQSTELMVNAALLDQGLIVEAPDGLHLVVEPGPRVASGPMTDRERRLLELVTSVHAEAHASILA